MDKSSRFSRGSELVWQMVHEERPKDERRRHIWGLLDITIGLNEILEGYIAKKRRIYDEP